MTGDSRPLRLGLALSGGGSRAIAFHLGCLRALNEIGILNRIDVISSVSGGSVLAGLYCAREEPFEAFEARVRAMLRAGLQDRIVTALVSPLGLRAFGSFAITLASAGALSFTASTAPVYTVTRQDDPSPALSGCSASACTLRSAISASNSVPGAILVPAGTYTLALGASGEDANAGGDLDLRAGMSIYGAGADATIIDANHKDRIFDVDPDSFSAPATGRVTALIADLSLVNGGGSSFYGDGGAIRAYSSGSSALVSNDYLVLDHVRIRDSRSQLNGGAVALSARGQFIGCEFSNNYANSTGGALTLGPSFAGGDTIIDLIDSTVAGNQSPSGFSGGGGIKTTARLRVVNSTIANNTTGYHGGGIYTTGTGALIVRSSTIANNVAASVTASANGGGIRVDNGTLSLANTILAGNSRGAGASVRLQFQGKSAEVTLPAISITTIDWDKS